MEGKGHGVGAACTWRDGPGEMDRTKQILCCIGPMSRTGEEERERDSERIEETAPNGPGRGEDRSVEYLPSRRGNRIK